MFLKSAWSVRQRSSDGDRAVRLEVGGATGDRVLGEQDATDLDAVAQVGDREGGAGEVLTPVESANDGEDAVGIAGVDGADPVPPSLVRHHTTVVHGRGGEGHRQVAVGGST